LERKIYIFLLVLYEITKTDLIADLLDKHWVLVRTVYVMDLMEIEGDI